MILYPFLIKTISTNLLTNFNNQKIETENKKVKKLFKVNSLKDGNLCKDQHYVSIL